MLTSVFILNINQIRRMNLIPAWDLTSIKIKSPVTVYNLKLFNSKDNIINRHLVLNEIKPFLLKRVNFTTSQIDQLIFNEYQKLLGINVNIYNLKSLKKVKIYGGDYFIKTFYHLELINSLYQTNNCISLKKLSNDLIYKHAYIARNNLKTLTKDY
jgi:hypothetical protein